MFEYETGTTNKLYLVGSKFDLYPLPRLCSFDLFISQNSTEIQAKPFLFLYQSELDLARTKISKIDLPNQPNRFFRS